jgi:syndecan 1
MSKVRATSPLVRDPCRTTTLGPAGVVGVGVGLEVGRGVGCGVGCGVGWAVGVGVGRTVGRGVGVERGLGVGPGLGRTVACGVGLGGTLVAAGVRFGVDVGASEAAADALGSGTAVPRLGTGFVAPGDEVGGTAGPQASSVPARTMARTRKPASRIELGVGRREPWSMGHPSTESWRPVAAATTAESRDRDRRSA